MHAWEMEAYPIGDCRMPHHLFPPKMLNPDQVTQMAGVIYYRVDLDDTNAMKKRLSRVKSEFNMINQDIFTMDDKMIDFTQKLQDMYEPVEKSDETVVMVLEGAMYYDVEFEDDRWIRIHAERGDLLVIPKGRCFRSATTSQNFAKIQRFTKDSNGIIY